MQKTEERVELIINIVPKKNVASDWHRTGQNEHGYLKCAAFKDLVHAVGVDYTDA